MNDNTEYDEIDIENQKFELRKKINRKISRIKIILLIILSIIAAFIHVIFQISIVFLPIDCLIYYGVVKMVSENYKSKYPDLYE